VHERAACAVAEHPPVLPGLVELAEIPVDDPGCRLVRMAEDGPLVGEPPQVAVQLAEDLGGHLCPVVGGPAPNDRVEPFDHHPSVGPAQGPQFGAEPLPDPSDGRLARLDQWLVGVATDVEPEEVEALIEGDDARLVLVESQTSRRQPLRQPGLDLERFLPGVAERDEIIGVPDNRWGAHRHPTGVSAGRAVADPGGLLHPVQGDVQQHRANHTALRSSLLGAMQHALLDHARLQPLPDHPPCWERAERGQDVVVGDAVERPGQVCVQNPLSLRALALDDLVDRLDRVMAAAARPKPVGPRLEPRLPLGFQRVEHSCLMYAINENRLIPDRADCPAGACRSTTASRVFRG